MRPLVLIAGSGTYLYLLGDPLRRYLSRGKELVLRTGDAAATLTAHRRTAGSRVDP